MQQKDRIESRRMLVERNLNRLPQEGQEHALRLKFFAQGYLPRGKITNETCPCHLWNAGAAKEVTKSWRPVTSVESSGPNGACTMKGLRRKILVRWHGKGVARCKTWRPGP
jgi:hypothetical protein